ncbi:unnamed protein product, partial [Amoebophrya sp. A120]
GTPCAGRARWPRSLPYPPPRAGLFVSCPGAAGRCWFRVQPQPICAAQVLVAALPPRSGGAFIAAAQQASAVSSFRGIKQSSGRSRKLCLPPVSFGDAGQATEISSP